MGIADAAVFVHDAHQRHTTEFEEADLLPIQRRDAMFGVGEANEGNLFFGPVLLEGDFGVWTNGKDLRAATFEFFVFVTQARQRRAAVRSGKAAQEIQKHRLAVKVREANMAAAQIFDFKFGGVFTRGEEFHFSNALAFFQMSSNIFTVSFPVNVFCWLG